MSVDYVCDKCGLSCSVTSADWVGWTHTLSPELTPTYLQAVLLGAWPQDTDWDDWCPNHGKGPAPSPMRFRQFLRRAFLLVFVAFDVWVLHQVIWWMQTW